MRVIFLLFLLMIGVSAWGQELQSFSKIKLKNGSQFKVVITENVPGKYLKIQLPDSPETVISYDNVLSVRHKNYVYNSRFVLPKGFYMDGSFGLLFGNSSEYSGSRLGMSLSVAANYRFNSYLSLGVGIEPTTIHINSSYLLLPMYLHFSGNMIERKTSAFYALDFGYSTAKTNTTDDNAIDTKGGFFLRPGFGIRFNKVAIGLSYQIQGIEATYINDRWWGGNRTTIEERTMRNFRVSTTVIF